MPPRAHTQVMTALLALMSVWLLPLVSAVRDHKAHDRIAVLVNNVGPFHNPAESYKYYSLYYSLPYCSPRDLDVHAAPSAEADSKLASHEQFHEHADDDNLGHVLAGDRRRQSLYDIRFKVDVQWAALCHFKLTQDEIRAFMNAIKQHYIFEMFVDDLPVKGFVGEMEQSPFKVDQHTHNRTRIYLFTHLDFSIAYNNNNVIAVNLTTDPQQRVELEYGRDIDVEFSYAVHWHPTSVPAVDRMLHHAASAIGEQAVEIHMLSFFNSVVLVILLTAFLAVILMRVLKKDFARYMELDEEESGAAGTAGAADGSGNTDDEVGWKLVHGDVFRYPVAVMLFSSMVGTGAQMLALVISLLALAVVGTFYPGNRGSLYIAAVAIYSLTSLIAGYTATALYMQLGGVKWATNALLTASLFAVPFVATFSVMNSIAWYYGSTSALPAMTIVVVIAIWLLVSFPLTIFGSLQARKRFNGVSYPAPCKTNRVEREIPPVVWYRHPLLQLLIAGFLPFSAIYIELHYIFAAVWGHRVYTLFGILSLTFLMLIIVTAFITVALTYFQLASEDYHWWWRSFLSGASTGVFMYAYAAFYYMYRSEMSGTLQGAFFFGYMLMVSYAFALMLGTVGFWMAQLFVRHIYSSIKID